MKTITYLSVYLAGAHGPDLMFKLMRLAGRIWPEGRTLPTPVLVSCHHCLMLWPDITSLLCQVDAKKLQKAEAKLKEKLEKRTGSDPKLRPAEMWACLLSSLWFCNTEAHMLQLNLRYLTLRTYETNFHYSGLSQLFDNQLIWSTIT